MRMSDQKSVSKTLVLITGAAGFIGFHTALRLLQEGRAVVGIDNLNDYYDVALKKDRLSLLQQFPDFHFHKVEIGRASCRERVLERV